MKLALLGAGRIVQEVLPVLKKISGIELSAILAIPECMNQANDLAQRYGIAQPTSQYDVILNSSDVDTVYIGTPNSTHYDFAKQALLAGKNVISEKPFTLLSSELDDLIAIAQEKKLFLLEAITTQYLPNVGVVKDNLAMVGDVKLVVCNFSQYSSRYDAFKRGEITPAFNPNLGGGALRDLNIYNIHLLVGLFGIPKSVHYYPNIDKGIDTSGVLMMDYDNFQAICIAAKDCDADRTTTVQGNKGTITILGPNNSVPAVQLQAHGKVAQRIDKNGDNHRMQAEFEAFECMIRKRDYERANQQLQQSRSVMQVLDMVGQYID